MMECHCGKNMVKNGTRKRTMTIMNNIENISLQKWLCPNGHCKTSILSDIDVLQEYHDNLVLSIMNNGYQEVSRKYKVSRHYLYGLYKKWITIHNNQVDILPNVMGIFSCYLSSSERFYLFDMERESILNIISLEDKLSKSNDVNLILIDVNLNSKDLAYMVHNNVIITKKTFKNFCKPLIKKKFKTLCYQLNIQSNNNYNLSWNTFWDQQYNDNWPDDIIEFYNIIENMFQKHPDFLKYHFQTWDKELKKGMEYFGYNDIFDEIEILKKLSMNKKPQRSWEINRGFLLNYNSEEIYDGHFRGISIKNTIERLQ
mgnify:CR=1 FL=1